MSGDLRAAVEDIVVDAWNDDTPTDALAAVRDLIPEVAVLAQVLPDDTVCACLHETGERKVRRYDRCERCGAFMVADEGAVLVTDPRQLAQAIEDVTSVSFTKTDAAAILRHLRETT